MTYTNLLNRIIITPSDTHTHTNSLEPLYRDYIAFLDSTTVRYYFVKSIFYHVGGDDEPITKNEQVYVNALNQINKYTRRRHIRKPHKPRNTNK